MHLCGAVLFVSNLARMREFYAEMLQTPPGGTDYPDSYAVFDLSGDKLFLHAIPPEYAGEPGAASPTREENPIKLIFAVENVASARARLHAIGASILERPWQNPDESCDAVDPEGNVFQIAVGRR